MSGELSLGLAGGFRKRRDQQKQEAIAEAERVRENKRQDVSDARVAEQYDYAKKQRPKQEEMQDLSLKSAKRASEVQERSISDAQKAAQEEGFYDLMDQLERGVDPGVALNQYNRRGSHKIDPKSFAYDAARKRVKFIDDDGSPFEGDVKQIKSVISDSLTSSQSKTAPSKLADNEALVDSHGRVLAQGPLYGKQKDTSSKAVIKGKPGDWYRDPDTKKWAQVPGKSGDKSGKGPLPGGNKAGTWSLQSAQKSVREILAAKVGLKYDSETEQITGGKPGATDAWVELAAKGDEVLSRVKDSMGPAQIAHMVADAYSGVLPLADYQAEAGKNMTRQKWFDPRTPDNVATFDEPEDKFQGRLANSAKAARDAAMKQAADTLERNLMPFMPAEDEVTDSAMEPAGYDDNGDPVDENGEPIVDPQDEMPAVDPATAAARPRTGKQQYEMTVDRVVAGNDESTQVALKALRAKPQILGMLTAKVKEGQAPVVKFPDGNLYYLAGNELKRLNAKPPAKGK